MTTVRIAPGPVRQAGLAAITVADDLQGQAGQLSGVALPKMPPSMAARHQSILSAVASRLTTAGQALGSAGAELQVRAAAAEAADAPGSTRGIGAGSVLSGSLQTTATVVLAGGVTETARLTVTRGGVEATNPATGLKVTMPELVRDSQQVLSTPSTAGPPSAQTAAPTTPATTRDTSSGSLIDGPPAAAVQQAVGGGGGGGFDPVDPAPSGAQSLTAGDAVDPSAPAPGEHATGDASTGVPVPTDMPEGDDAQRQDWACWMAGSAAHHGLPPELPVMLALAQTGLRNTPAGSEQVGFFGLDPRSAYAPAGHGVSRDEPPSGDWWADHPGAQLDEVLGRLRGTEGGLRDAELDDPEALGRWAADAIPGFDAGSLAGTQDAAATLVEQCKHAGGGAGAAGAAAGDALSVARSQLGVQEVGTNAGPKVNEYLGSAQVASGNPWCAAFVTWSLQQSGTDMPGTGWAAVATWVAAAREGQHGLQLVDAAHARPGDIVAYDWGGDNNFASDGHIGFLESTVEGGRFTAVEGNAEDAVTRMERTMGVGNVVFIRAGA
ncbi:MAG: CHAP domain-containing protein [Solirubrobacteraceae bacterium]|nr:CHAP domain-containing protein [Solirubrobacteraceae bacterium]